MAHTEQTVKTFTISELKHDFARALRAQNKSHRTLETYLAAVNQLETHITERGMPLAISSITREHVESFIEHLLKKWKPATASNRYRALQSFFGFCLEEGEIKLSPMRNMTPPMVPEDPPALLTDRDIEALLKACSGTSFEARRDYAVIRLFLDTGLRLSELAGIGVADVDANTQTVQVVGKGSRVRILNYDGKTAQAMDRYRRARSRHRNGYRDEFWLGYRGPLLPNGIRQMVRRRSRQAGVENIHPHMFRHHFAHTYLKLGGGETNLMALAGWKSRSMVSRYAQSAASERAREEKARLGLGYRY